MWDRDGVYGMVIEVVVWKEGLFRPLLKLALNVQVSDATEDDSNAGACTNIYCYFRIIVGRKILVWQLQVGFVIRSRISQHFFPLPSVRFLPFKISLHRPVYLL